ncbi:long-chain-fatty-acid--CoA ligase [Sulfuriferula plumbiphila]|uniref:Long-chain-fatty-acid--CoA ligase n=2 Tax=Sulfuriferula plumbiphila TaxID=171865 RepID=A0A512L6U1_9PROT|nr:long-chain-fatty-acid--CoA ligase [Sulfuriferula plumbiphila]GEP30199.1 long-chain-fatty-acid--CoA ligase [Sulfuriferula plumbiphila]
MGATLKMSYAHPERVITPDAFDFNAYQDETIFHWDERRRTAFQQEYVRTAFAWHFERCRDYRRYAEGQGIGPEALRRGNILNRVPQIPTILFKSTEILSVARDDIAKTCESSGTRGRVSRVFRDEVTLDRLLCSIIAGMKYIYDIDNDRAIVLNLGPSTEEAGDIWFSYVTSIADLLYKTYYFVAEQKYLLPQLVDFLAEYRSEKTPILLGAPIMFKHLLAYMEEKNLRLRMPLGALVITAGGWKKYSGEAIQRDRLELLLSERLGVRAENVRDSFNQVELNTVIFECQHKRKHVPPWLKVIARNPTTLMDVGEDRSGILSYLDASNVSYPCFIISEDIGRVIGGCPCGRTGQVIEVERRVNRVESRGCAIKMDSYVAEA